MKSEEDNSEAMIQTFETINMMELIYEEFKIISMAYKDPGEEFDSYPFNIELHIQYSRVGTLTIM